MLWPLRYLYGQIVIIRGMRIAVLIITFTICGMAAFAQKKGSVPSVRQTMPDKDPVVTIDDIQAGKSKRYHWHSSYALFAIDMPKKAGSFVDVSFNGKTILSHYQTKHPKPKARKLNLNTGTNTLIISPNKSNKQDFFTLNMSLSEKAMDYNINAQLKKGKSDTLIIIKH